MRSIAFTLSAVGLSALALSGCNNGLNQPEPGQTPTAVQAPGPNAAGAPLVPANNPNDPVPITPRNQPAGQPLVPPTSNVR
jgi:hypothetical protein